MMNVPARGQQDPASLRHIFSGGAPVSPALVAAFSSVMGHQIRPAYGMTETTAPTHAAPLTGEVPVDPSSGAMAIGLPLPNVEAKIIDSHGVSCTVGEAGEICVRGPQVMAGYLRTSGNLPCPPIGTHCNNRKVLDESRQQNTLHYRR